MTRNRRAPTYIQRDKHDNPEAKVWILPTGSPRPEKYDESYSPRSRPGYTKYILWLIPITGIFLCVWLRPMFRALIKATGIG